VADGERSPEEVERLHSTRASKLADRAAALGRQKSQLVRLQNQIAKRLAELEAKSKALAEAEQRRVEASSRLQREATALTKRHTKFAAESGMLKRQQRELAERVERESASLEERARLAMQETAERRRRLDEREADMNELERSLGLRREKLSAQSAKLRQAERRCAEAILTLRAESTLARRRARTLLRLNRRLETRFRELESRTKALEGLKAQAAELAERSRRLGAGETVLAACAAELDVARTELARTHQASLDDASWLQSQLAALVDQKRELGLDDALVARLTMCERAAREFRTAIGEAVEAVARVQAATAAVAQILEQRPGR
jgi:chromosome segregation ATPase